MINLEKLRKILNNYLRRCLVKMELFKKPKWLKPELNESIYYVHIGIILVVVYGLMNLYDPQDMFLMYGLYLIIGDVIAHTILKLD